REQLVEQHAERAPQRQLVRDRIRELQTLDELARRAAAPNAPPLAAPRQAPGAPAVRPQSFGDGAARKPGKLTQPPNSKLLQLLLRLLLEREQVDGQRREELARLLVRDDEQLPRLRDRRRRERGELA